MIRLLQLLRLWALPIFAISFAVASHNDLALAEDSSPVDFARDVFPILQRSCLECHSWKKQEGGMRLDSAQSIAEAEVLSPATPDESELLRRICLPRNHADLMPPIGEPLPAEQVELIRKWIRQGALWPDHFKPSQHWSYVSPVRPAPPILESDKWSRSAIDQFVLSRILQNDLKPAPPAEPSTLLRRVYFDLIGLPPSPAEVDAFVASPTETAYEQVVKDLLNRPQFGEKWARHWLDLARYSDSHGFQRDDLRDLWAYRDWVIRAMNDDMPFDQFTIEQVAGDLLPGATESQKIATGFHRCSPTNCEAGSLPEETRTEQLIDRVNTTGAVWLGTTLECAQCHDHKFDPFSMQDYYRLLAFFNSTAIEADLTDSKQPSSIAFQGPLLPISDANRDQERLALENRSAKLHQLMLARRRVLNDDLESWAARKAAAKQSNSVSHPLNIQEFSSLGTADTYHALDDFSILLSGDDPPAKDRYTLVANTNLSDIRAIRLDVLTHDSLPGSGPGRGASGRANFVLNEFSASIKSDDEVTRPIRFESARADFSQVKWDVTGAVDGAAETGWAIAPQFGKSHWALFVLPEPLDASSGLKLTIEMDQQFGNARTIGCFRISLVTGGLPSDAKESLPDKVVAALEKPASQWTDDDRKTLVEFRMQGDKPYQKLQTEDKALKQDIDNKSPETTLVMVELEQPRMTYMFERGDYRKLGKPVLAGTPASLHPLSVSQLTGQLTDQMKTPSNRLTLAKWLVDPANPLVARVVVNRWWAEIFGRGIVTTPEDFGVKGELPSHPELLDWLAVELMEHGWSMKHLLRCIVLSTTYRQSSRIPTDVENRDDQNRWLARGPRFRLDAELIRDNALAISGLLSLDQFGPPIRPPQPDGLWAKVGGKQYDYAATPGNAQYRRGIYVVLKRSAPYPSFTNFDATSRLTCTVKRSRTNTPLQALTLLNDPVYVECARRLAKRVLTELPNTTLPEQIAYAFQCCTSRKPVEEEVGALRRLYDVQVEAFEARASDAEKLAGKEAEQLQVSESQLAAWYNVATVLLNLHETITKP